MIQLFLIVFLIHLNGEVTVYKLAMDSQAACVAAQQQVMAGTFADHTIQGVSTGCVNANFAVRPSQGT